MPEVHKEHEIKDHSPSVAAFYSISNLQPLSLAGIGLGEYLIKKAVAELQAEFHGDIETYCTLSPLPDFRSWLKATVSGTGKFALHESSSLLTVQTGRDSASASQLLDSLALHLNCPTDRCLVKLVERLDEAGPNNWKDQPEIVYAVVRQLAARYLLLEKHRSKPLDSVARFHIGNGAELYRINVGADLSSKGWRNSYGCMVNYRYVLEDLHRNRIRFEESYGIQTSAEFHKPTF
jgi:malonyl-CoA decarboxylase